MPFASARVRPNSTRQQRASVGAPSGWNSWTLALGWGATPDGTVLRSDGGERAPADVYASSWSPDQTMLLLEDPDRVIALELDGGTQRDLGEGHDSAWRPRP